MIFIIKFNIIDCKRAFIRTTNIKLKKIIVPLIRLLRIYFLYYILHKYFIIISKIINIKKNLYNQKKSVFFRLDDSKNIL